MKNYIDRYQKVPVEEYPNSTHEKPCVSVCVITYQHSKFIAKCLDSILSQITDFPIEVLLGEDESTDGTREICVEYAKRFPEKIRLFLHKRENLIYVDGTPTGKFNNVYNLAHARGKYIHIMDGDDYWTNPNKLQNQVNILEKSLEYSGVSHETTILSQGKEVGKIGSYPVSKKVFTVEDTVGIRSPFHTSSFMFRASALNFPQWFFEVFSGDMATFSIVASKAPICHVSETMSAYRKTGEGLTQHNDITKNNFHTRRIKLLKHLRNYHAPEYEDIIQKSIQFHQSKLKEKTFLHKLRMKIGKIRLRK